jgi:serine protease
LGTSNQGERETFITSSASALDFGTTETGLIIDVGKSGPANMKFETWYREHEWLSLEAVNTDSNALGTLRVVVNRSELARGQYRSTLWFEADNKSIVSISVNVQVGESVTGEAGQQYALLLDAYTLTSQYWWSGKQQSENYNIGFEGVVSGYYYLMVGSDMDGDGLICDEGEFCRIYPTENDPKIIEVNNGDRSIGNFTMTVPSPKIGVSQASAVLVNENGTVDESSEAFIDFSERFGKSGWKIKR